MSKVVIIAEAGVNHNGDIEIAKRLIDAAAHAKADYVKFQTFKVTTWYQKLQRWLVTRSEIWIVPRIRNIKCSKN